MREAAAKGHTKAAIALIEHGADVNRANSIGRTALHFAAELATQHHGPETALVLIRHGAVLDAKDWQGRTPLDMSDILGRTAGARAIREEISLRHAQKVKAVRLGKRRGP